MWLDSAQTILSALCWTGDDNSATLCRKQLGVSGEKGSHTEHFLRAWIEEEYITRFCNPQTFSGDEAVAMELPLPWV